MAANKFATMLHRNTHRISVILIYAVLEWILILLLLLNSLFSYLISKFAARFGLKPPCLWCSRIDKFLEPSKPETSYTDLICEFHASEFSKLGYCSNHKKLAKASDMCEDCLPSEPSSNGNNNQPKPGRNFDFFSWVEEMGKISNDKAKNEKIKNGEKSSRCSCCDVSLNTKSYTPYWLFKPSWEVLDYVKKGNIIWESNNDNDKNGVQCSDQCDNVSEKRESNVDLEDDEVEEVEDDTVVPDIDEGVQVKDKEDKIVPEEQEIMDRDDIVFAVTNIEMAEESPKFPVKGRNSFRSSNSVMSQLYSGDDVSLEMLPAHLEKWSDHGDHFLVTIESIGDRKVKKSSVNDGEVKSELQFQRQDESNVDTSIVLEFGGEEGMLTEIKSNDKDEGDDSSAMLTEESCSESDHVPVAEATQIMVCNGDIVEETEGKGDLPNEPQADKTKSESFIEMEICDQELIDPPQFPVLISSVQSPRDHSLMNNHEARNSTGNSTSMTAYCQGAMEAEEVIKEKSPKLPETIKHRMNRHYSLMHQDLEKVEKEKALEIPNMEGPDDPNRKFPSSEKNESGTKEFSYPSVIEDDIQDGDGILTIEHLKSALAADRKVLNALYAELAAERSAAAIAANQTMVMIAKLQEEKASMQMEALQCQRMMEEQSEYDQEALKLLNELMVKREKEKQELEKELEIYRKKVYHYEEKEKRRLSRKSSIGRSTTTSSGSCHSEDGDSFNDRQENKQETPMDTVHNLEENGIESSRHLSSLDESLADFEVERLAILEQLKVLEEKLFTLDDEDDEDDEELFEDIQGNESFLGDTSKGFNHSHENTNGFTNTNGSCKSEDGEEAREKRNIGENGKRLLPLFETIAMENENEEQGSVSLVQENYSLSRCTSYSKKLAIEEEVDNVYQRLQALEADREFLKHCVISLKKGDKGMDLLEEILQHLRELKSVELRARNISDAASL